LKTLHELRGTIAWLEAEAKSHTSTSVGPAAGSSVGVVLVKQEPCDVVPVKQEPVDIVVEQPSGNASQSKFYFDS
jgi:hypothetical protein